MIVPDAPGTLPFVPLRDDLYTQDELTSRLPGRERPTLDEAVGEWFQSTGHGVDFAVVRALHDATIDVALARHLVGRSVVGVMGGHADARGSDRYVAVARLGRALSRSGFHVATGGGPGLMEAANLGAWFAPAPDTDLDAALELLGGAPSYEHDAVSYVEVAGAVRERWPVGGDSLGVPTWVYAEEPTSAFCTHIAKYFTNSIREDGLLALARAGVIYTPGGAGTAQEIFTDAAQNTNTLYEVRSPMVFLGRDFYEREEPELVLAVRRQAARFGWSELVTVVDDIDDAATFVLGHDPDGARNGGGAVLAPAAVDPNAAPTVSPALDEQVTTAPLRLAASAAALADDFARVRADLDVPTGFPPEVDAEAAAVATRGPQLPPGALDAERLDARDLELVTIDPPGSRDLDQAFHAERQGSGFRVRYAIADVAAFVAPGGALDREAFVRGETLYLPDGRAPLYPDVLGEGAASLLPGVDRPALLWTFELDAGARPLATRCERATVHSRAARSYADVQAALDRDDGSPSPSPPSSSSLALLRELGELLLDRERERRGVSIAAPSQEVVRAADGSYSLELEAPLPVETWNAQISLLTGREAARLMDEGGVGLVRTLPPPDDGIVGRLRHTARALGVAWPPGAAYADVVRGLRPDTRARATFLLQALHALRGAGYSVVTPEAPAPVHAAVGAPYADVTAPLRRLADRFANEVVLAVAGGSPPPAWAVDALPGLVEVMPRADRHVGAVDRACVDAIETDLLAGHVAATFPATVVDRHRRGVVVLLADIPVVATVVGDSALGEAVTVRLDALDPVARTSTFSLLPR